MALDQSIKLFQVFFVFSQLHVLNCLPKTTHSFDFAVILFQHQRLKNQLALGEELIIVLLSRQRAKQCLWLDMDRARRNVKAGRTVVIVIVVIVVIAIVVIAIVVIANFVVVVVVVVVGGGG